MDVSEAVRSRRSVRAFLDRSVAGEMIRRLVAEAARAPSGGNLQPWRLHVLSGEPLAKLKAVMQERIASHPKGEGTEYDVYPKALAGVYADRRYAVGEAMYTSLGVAREERQARRSWFARNYAFFDAPVGLFCLCERYMGAPQWSDLGMYLQTLMLLLRHEGLDSCAQECWALYPKTVMSLLEAPPEMMLFAGMAIGYRDPDHPVNAFPVERAHLDDFAVFQGL